MPNVDEDARPAAPVPSAGSQQSGPARGRCVAPGTIQAVHGFAWRLAGDALLMLAGLIVLRARRLRKRWRRRARLPTAQSHRIAHD